MSNRNVDFEVDPEAPQDVIEFAIAGEQAPDPEFEVNFMRDGKDATINGYNAITLDASDGNELVQDGDKFTVSAAPLQTELRETAESLQERIDAVSEIANGYVHEQGIASAVWTVQHNLDKYPSVTVVDSAGNEIVADIQYLSKSEVRITMTGASKGLAYLN